jgi:hypothetical protein
MSEQLYTVFSRNWWQDNPAWPGGLEPHPGVRHIIATGCTYSEARRRREAYRATHEPGRYSRKAECESE